MNDKITVINPIEYFTTIGEELVDIISSNNISIDDFLSKMDWNIKDIKSIKKIKKIEANKIEKIVNVERISDYLIKFQNDFNETSNKSKDTFTKHLKIYKKLQHIRPLLRNEFESGLDVLEDISDFLGFDNEEEILEKVRENIALYRISSFKPDSLNLFAWLKRGEIDFYKKNIAKYEKKSFLEWINDYEWKNHLHDIDYIKYNLPKRLEEFGIALVYTPHLNKTVFGAVRWFENRPLVQISDKGKCTATFWYTLFHEFGHVILHENDEIFEGTLDMPKSKINKKEQEANSFAYQYLFNGDNLRKYVFGYHGQFKDHFFLKETSRKFNVDNMFTAFWMKKAQIKSNAINNYIPYLEFE